MYTPRCRVCVYFCNLHNSNSVCHAEVIVCSSPRATSNLTHWRMIANDMSMKCIIIGSSNAMVPVRPQATATINDLLLSIGALWTSVNEIRIEILKNVFQETTLEDANYAVFLVWNIIGTWSRPRLVYITFYHMISNAALTNLIMNYNIANGNNSLWIVVKFRHFLHAGDIVYSTLLIAQWPQMVSTVFLREPKNLHEYFILLSKSATPSYS